MKTNAELCAEYRVGIRQMEQHREKLRRDWTACASSEKRRRIGKQINCISAAIADSVFAVGEMQPRKRGGNGG